MTAYIQKPFTVDILLSRVAAALQTHPEVTDVARLSRLSAG
jgi:hypothetical protein